jgi:hypothetical protein
MAFGTAALANGFFKVGLHLFTLSLRCSRLSRRWSPTGRLSVLFCAEPSFARLTHVYAGVIELPRTKINSFALAIDVSFDNAL